MSCSEAPVVSGLLVPGMDAGLTVVGPTVGTMSRGSRAGEQDRAQAA